MPKTTTRNYSKKAEKRLLKESKQTIKAYRDGKIKGYTSTKKLIHDLLDNEELV